ncbi:hypothetical protein Dimus_022795 [Dionaea muscipula]
MHKQRTLEEIGHREEKRKSGTPFNSRALGHKEKHQNRTRTHQCLPLVRWWSVLRVQQRKGGRRFQCLPWLPVLAVVALDFVGARRARVREMQKEEGQGR